MTNTDLLIAIKEHIDTAIKHAASLDTDVEFPILDRMHADDDTLRQYIENLTHDLRSEITARIRELNK